MNSNEWSYLIAPTFVARMKGGELEILQLTNDEWVPCYDAAIDEMVQQEGYSSSEEGAMEAHRLYKEMLLK